MVVHPGGQHSYQTVLGLQKSGLLHSYVTGFYYKRSSLWVKILECVPDFLLKRFRRKMSLKFHPQIEDEAVCVLPWGELVGTLGFFRYNRKIRWLDGQAAKRVLCQKPKVVICYDTCAVRTFAAAKKVGAVCILDQTIGHLSYAEKVFLQYGLTVDISSEMMDEAHLETQLADHIVVGSEYVRRTLLEAGVPDAKIFVLPYGVDTQAFHPAPRKPDGEFRMLFAGRINHRKGIQHVYQAFEELEKECPDLRLHLAGTVWGDTTWMKRFGEKLVYHGQVPHSRLSSVMQSCDIFVHPSLHEGSALSIYEAMASGLPVVTTSNSGSVVEDGVSGFIVETGEVQSLRDKILKLRNDEFLRKKMGESARRRAEQFTWEIYQNRYAQKINEMVKKA